MKLDVNIHVFIQEKYIKHLLNAKYSKNKHSVSFLTIIRPGQGKNGGPDSKFLMFRFYK